MLQSYCKVMEGYINDGYAQLVPESGVEGEEVGRIWYLPHHRVINPRKPNKLRVKIDSAAEYQGTSLNRHLMQGPTMTNNLSGVLLRFRKKE